MIVECQKPLVRLLAPWPEVEQLVPQGEPLPPFDVHSPLLSLPGIFHASLEKIPARVPYLFAAPDLIKHWRGELSDIHGFKIGIVWHGNPQQENNRTRSIPLSCFELLAGLPESNSVSLQKGPGVEELQDAAERFSVRELGSRLDDFMDTAAAMMNLDLVIACDTAVAHLAGRWVFRSGSHSALSPTGGGCWTATTALGIPRCGSSDRASREIGAGVFERIKDALAAMAPA